jgi:dTDP-4-dehydrorhamnose 3,5-epimerase
VNCIQTSIPGVVIIEPRIFGDDRGFFFESYSAHRFTSQGMPAVFVQDNHSMSRRDTVRGLHYQLKHAQAKLCRVIRGEVLDVAVDIRRGSPTFGKWIAVVLSEENRREVYIPAGFAHGFRVLSDTAEFLYKCDDYYAPDDEYGIAWDDPELGIDWGQPASPILSPKDLKLPRLAEIAPDLFPRYVADRDATGNKER